jgi:hypothetical protein
LFVKSTPEPLRAHICKRLRRPGIDSEDSIPPAYVGWRVGTTNRVVVHGNRFLGSLKGLQIRALVSPKQLFKLGIKPYQSLTVPFSAPNYLVLRRPAAGARLVPYSLFLASGRLVVLWSIKSRYCTRAALGHLSDFVPFSLSQETRGYKEMSVFCLG